MEEQEKTALDTLYLINDTETDISLEIITGGIGQTSTIRASIDGIFSEQTHGHLVETLVGKNSTLNRKILTIACTITDTSRETNYTELIVRLRGGVFYKEYTLYATVEEEGDTVTYVCIIRFLKPY